jgi:hypothetical protein
MTQKLVVEYWYESTSSWITWKQVNGNINQNNFYCYREKKALLMSGLDISGFNATSLSNFKYRIKYTDPTDGSFGWGFCFDSPVLKSNPIVGVPNFAINPFPADNATGVPAGPLDYTWEADTNGEIPIFYKVYFGLHSVSNLYYAGDFSYDENSLYRIISLYSTDYYAKVIPVNLAGEAINCPVWHFTSEDEPPVPVNDLCSGAIHIDLQAQGSDCPSPIIMNNYSATNSTVSEGIPDASCTYHDPNSGDLWYSFEAPDSGDIKIKNLWTGDEWFLMGFVIYEDCSATTEVLCGFLNDNLSQIYTGLTADQTYYIRVFDPSSIPPWEATKKFCIEEYTPPASPPVNDECIAAINLDTQYEKVDFITSTCTYGTIDGATDSGIPATTCIEGSNPIPNDDVWYTFTAEVADLNISIDDAYDTNCTVELFSGDCTGLSQIQCASGNTNPTVEATDLSIGDTYYIRVFSDESYIPSTPVFGISVWSEESDPHPASISDEFQNINLYPNPVTNILKISSDKIIDKLSIYTIFGQQLNEFYLNTQTYQIDMKDFSSGIYILKIKSDNKIKACQVIKK